MSSVAAIRVFARGYKPRSTREAIQFNQMARNLNKELPLAIDKPTGSLAILPALLSFCLLGVSRIADNNNGAWLANNFSTRMHTLRRNRCAFAH